MYYDILRIVEEVTGVTAKEMLTSNAEENVDARHILVYVLGNRGFSDNKIAELTGLTRPSIYWYCSGDVFRVLLFHLLYPIWHYGLNSC